METSGEIFRRERRLVAEDSEASRNDRPRNASCKCNARCARQRVAHVRAYLTHRRGVAAAAAPRRGEASSRKMENRGDVNPGLLHGQGCIIITRIRRVSRNPHGWTATIVLAGVSRTSRRFVRKPLLSRQVRRGKFVAASSSRQSFALSISTDETLNEGCSNFTFEIALHRYRDNVRRN